MLDELTYEIIGAAIEVHKSMGRALLESVYHECMKEEFAFRKINFKPELKIPVNYRGKLLNVDFRGDLLVENNLVVELKATNDFRRKFYASLSVREECHYVV